MLQRAPFTKDEIKKVAFDMAPYKSSGKDGLHAEFFYRTWEIAGDSFCEYVLKFLYSRTLPEGANDTIITLIPKVKHLEVIS